MRTIPFFRTQAPLTTAERLAKRRLIVQDTLSLLAVTATTVVLAILTYLIFQSYSQHQRDAAARWKRRGEAALRNNNPKVAVFDLRAALGYEGGDRTTEIDLADALARAGRLQEATAYFNTLWEREPGNGNINLQLARLAGRQQQPATALEHYHAAIYGVWEGDGAIRRRQVRLELVRYLIQQNRLGEARDELLIAAGNDTGTPSLLETAGLLAQAHAYGDALHLYREVAGRRPPMTEAFEGAGQMAFAMGHFRTAHLFLERAVTVASPQQPLVNHELTEHNLQVARAVMAAYPSPSLPERERLRRVVQAYATARRRFQACTMKAPAAGAATGGQPGAPTDAARTHEIAALAERWQQAPSPLTVQQLQRDDGLETVVMQLVYDTELALDSAPAAAAGTSGGGTPTTQTATAPAAKTPAPARVAAPPSACGPPAGLDAALLRIAATPDGVDQ